MVVPQLSQPVSSDVEPLTTISVPSMPILPTRWPDGALDGDLDLSFARPDPAADAVLAVGNNGQLFGAVLDGLLKLLFEILRRDPFPVDIALDNHFILKPFLTTEITEGNSLIYKTQDFLRALCGENSFLGSNIRS